MKEKKKIQESGSELIIGCFLDIGFLPYQLARETRHGLYLKTIALQSRRSPGDPIGAVYYSPWTEIGRVRLMEPNEIEELACRHFDECAIEVGREESGRVSQRLVLREDVVKTLLSIFDEEVMAKPFLEVPRLQGYWDSEYVGSEDADGMPWPIYGVKDVTKRFHNETRTSHLFPLLKHFQKAEVLRQMAEKAKNRIVRKAAAKLLAERQP